MTNVPPRSIGSDQGESIPSLDARVAERVMKARLALESAPEVVPTASEKREIQSLKRVFRDMGYAYRRYRSQTGGPVLPGLRDAAYGFRANPSLPALIGVAAFLDDLDLLS